VELACPTCRQTLSLPAQLPGSLVRCPHCTTVLDVSAAMGRPAAAPQPPAAPPGYPPPPGYAPAPYPPAPPSYAAAPPAYSPAPAPYAAAPSPYAAAPGYPQVSAGPAVATAPPPGGAAEEERRPIRRRKQGSGFGFVLVALLMGGLVLFGAYKIIQKRRQDAAALAHRPMEVAFLEARAQVAAVLERSSSLTVPDEHGEVKDLGEGRWQVVGYADEPGLSGQPIRRAWTADMERVGEKEWKLARLEFDGRSVDLGEESSLADVDDVTDEEIPDFNWVDTRVGRGGDDEENPFGDAWQAHGAEFYRDQTVGWAVGRVQSQVETALGLRPVLLVWLVDQSPSATDQRNDFAGELPTMYSELNVARQAGAAGDDVESAPLLSAVVAYGKEATFVLEEPSGNLADVESAVRAVTDDTSGVENTFAAIQAAVAKYESYQKLKDRTVMFVVVSDEAGDDEAEIDAAINALKLAQIPLSVIGTRAPFGRRMPPGPNPEVPADFGRAGGGVPTLRQGPETPQPEHINLAFWNPSMGYDDSEALDSGFGPYSLTRACNETGGTYYACRMGGGGWGGSGLAHFFDPKIMRKYAPEYLTADAYAALIKENKARQALIDAAKLPRVETMKFVTISFPRIDDAAQNKIRLDDAQKGAATIEPKVDAIYTALKAGEADRAKLTGLRWQAAYDLAMGRALAAKVRTEGYNAMLAQVKSGFTFKDQSNDVMYLEQTDSIGAGSSYERMLKDSRKYLERVIKEHPGTPWAFLAERELSTPCGWEWVEGKLGQMPKAFARP
jgi:hypothetical protein